MILHGGNVHEKMLRNNQQRRHQLVQVRPSSDRTFLWLVIRIVFLSSMLADWKTCDAWVIVRQSRMEDRRFLLCNKQPLARLLFVSNNKDQSLPVENDVTIYQQLPHDGGDPISFDSLVEMDVVVYRHTNKMNTTTKYLLGTVEEDGRLSPLSVWTTDPVFGTSLEFLVDEEDRYSLDDQQIQIVHVLQESEVSYGSRQCQRGAKNPHGEHSELLYFVETSVIDKFGVKLLIKPELEILW